MQPTKELLCHNFLEVHKKHLENDCFWTNTVEVSNSQISMVVPGSVIKSIKTAITDYDFLIK